MASFQVSQEGSAASERKGCTFTLLSHTIAILARESLCNSQTFVITISNKQARLGMVHAAKNEAGLKPVKPLFLASCRSAWRRLTLFRRAGAPLAGAVGQGDQVPAQGPAQKLHLALRVAAPDKDQLPLGMGLQVQLPAAREGTPQRCRLDACGSALPVRCHVAGRLCLHACQE